MGRTEGAHRREEMQKFTSICLVPWEWGREGEATAGVCCRAGMKPGIGFGGEEGEWKSEAHLPASLAYLILWQSLLVGSQRSLLESGSGITVGRKLGGEVLDYLLEMRAGRRGRLQRWR